MADQRSGESASTGATANPADRGDKQPGRGNAQQGTGGLGSGEASSTPTQSGHQPHLGNQADHTAPSKAPAGTGVNEGSSAAEAGNGSSGTPAEFDAMDKACRK